MKNREIQERKIDGIEVPINGEIKENILFSLKENLFWKDFIIRNGNSVFTIKGQNPIIDKEKKETIILDNDFQALFPKKIDEIYLLTENKELIPLFTENIMKNFNSFLAGESDINENLYHGDCMDFVYVLSPGKWVDKDKNGGLGIPNKEYFSPYNNQNIAYKPVLYYHQGEWKHAALSLGKGICLSRMGEGGDLLITSIDELKQVYGEEVWIQN